MSMQKGMLFNTVEIVQLDNNHYRYSSRDYSKATLARKIQKDNRKTQYKTVYKDCK